jgi:hypothetical protein
MRGGLRTDTDCSGNGLGDKFAHRVEIQTPQPWLHSGLKHRGSQAPIGLAPNRLALTRTLGNRTGHAFSIRSQHARALSHSSATRHYRLLRWEAQPIRVKTIERPFTGKLRISQSQLSARNARSTDCSGVDCFLLATDSSSARPRKPGSLCAITRLAG